MSCVKCGGSTDGYVCEMCGDEMEIFVRDHECGGEHVVPKCKGCGQPQMDCTCEINNI